MAEIWINKNDAKKNYIQKLDDKATSDNNHKLHSLNSNRSTCRNKYWTLPKRTTDHDPKMVISLSALILFKTNILCYANRHKSTFRNLHIVMCHEMKYLHLCRVTQIIISGIYVCMYNRLASASSGWRVLVVRLVGWFVYICDQCNFIVTFPRLLLKLTNHVHLIHEPKILIWLRHPIDNIQKSI